jgi:hypothetical protein
MEIILLLSLALGFGGGWFLKSPTQLDCVDKSLSTVSCPEPTPLTDATFGGHILKVQELGGQYRECRRACLSK